MKFINRSISTLFKFSCMSDEQRWDAEKFDWEWMNELDENDRKIAIKLDDLAEGELSGQASVAQFFELVLEAKKEGTDPNLIADWGEFLAYSNIIVQEETRHGFAFGTISNYVKTGKRDYVETISIRDFSSRYIWCYENRRYWDLYSYALAHLFGEVINTELYRDMRKSVNNEPFRRLILNVMKDEARHTRAWAEIISRIASGDIRHKESFLKSLDRGLLYHNAMVHETYFEGQNKMMPFFGSGTVERVITKKYNLLNEIFGKDNPYTESDLMKMHIDFLARSRGKKRAEFSSTETGNIVFS